MNTLEPRDRLIVALDTPSSSASLELVKTLGERARFYKVGWRLFLQAGLGLVDELKASGKRVFLDLKLDDIGETVRTATAELRDRADFLTLSGGPATVRAAAEGRGARALPKLLFVPLLSSLDETDLAEMLGMPLPAEPGTLLRRYVAARAEAGVRAGADGLIVSGAAIALARAAAPEQTLLVCPGIRPAGSSADDQKRATTPAEAIAAGADYLVVGRPVWRAADPAAAFEAIVDEIGAGLAQPAG